MMMMMMMLMTFDMGCPRYKPFVDFRFNSCRSAWRESWTGL